jgi:centrosomal protein CEP104
MLGECSRKEEVKRCGRCSEAIMEKEFRGHVARGVCERTRDAGKRCPFCHGDVGDGGWKGHFGRDMCGGKKVVGRSRTFTVEKIAK